MMGLWLLVVDDVDVDIIVDEICSRFLFLSPRVRF